MTNMRYFSRWCIISESLWEVTDWKTKKLGSILGERPKLPRIGGEQFAEDKSVEK